MNLKKLHEMGTELEGWLRMRGHPVAVKLNVKNWIDGKDVYSQLSGHAACVYVIVPALLKRDGQIAIPCKGD